MLLPPSLMSVARRARHALLVIDAVLLAVRTSSVYSAAAAQPDEVCRAWFTATPSDEPHQHRPQQDDEVVSAALPAHSTACVHARMLIVSLYLSLLPLLCACGLPCVCVCVLCARLAARAAQLPR